MKKYIKPMCLWQSDYVEESGYSSRLDEAYIRKTQNIMNRYYARKFLKDEWRRLINRKNSGWRIEKFQEELMRVMFYMEMLEC